MHSTSIQVNISSTTIAFISEKAAVRIPRSHSTGLNDKVTELDCGQVDFWFLILYLKDTTISNP